MPQLLVDFSIETAWLDTLHQRRGLTIALAPGDPNVARELPADLLQSVQGMLTMFPPTNHADMKSLQWMQLGSAGFTQVENLGLSARGVHVCTASGVNDVPIAEWAIAMMVALARDLPLLFRNQQAGVWDRSAVFQQEIRGRTLGIWGYGGIGRETARIAKAMGLKVHVLTHSGRINPAERFHLPGTGDDAGALPDQIFSVGELEAFCRSLDFLLLAMPLTPENKGVVDRQVFEWLPTHAYFLNPARGPLANEADLLAALQTGQIAGAALDTHFYYPMPPDHPLWRMKNVIMTPHISGSSQAPFFKSRLWTLFEENVARWQAGTSLLNELSSDRLDPNVGGTP